MRRYALTMILLFSILLGGCESWMNGSYLSVKPHQEQDSRPGNGSSEVASYLELRDALSDLVAGGIQKGVIYITGFEEATIRSYMDNAIRYVRTNTALGAYAVDKISYDLGTNSGKQAAAVEITYIHNRSEILRIKSAEDMDAAVDMITSALEKCDASVVLRVREFADKDFTQLVQDYMDAHPESCMEMPQVTAAVYPDSGVERVIEVTFTYQTSREALRAMQERVRPVFASARLYVSGDAPVQQKYAQLYSFLMERYDYTVETSITPSYSLLCHGVGDSRAFAVTYAAMCTQAELECWVVSGTRAGEPWFWNIICDDGTYYHVDLLLCNSAGGFQGWLDENMVGYVWDYSAYPVCKAPEEEEPE